MDLQARAFSRVAPESPSSEGVFCGIFLRGRRVALLWQSKPKPTETQEGAGDASDSEARVRRLWVDRHGRLDGYRARPGRQSEAGGEQSGGLGAEDRDRSREQGCGDGPQR